MKGGIIIELLLQIIILITSCKAYNILQIMPLPMKSHYIMLRKIGLELAHRGHNVTVITAFEELDPPSNYRQVLVTINQKGRKKDLFECGKMSDEERLTSKLGRGILNYVEIVLKTTQFQEFLNQRNKFDVVINEQFNVDAFNILAHKYNAPLVLVTAFGNSMMYNIATRNPLQLTTILTELVEVSDPSSFMGRLRNFYFLMYEYIGWRYWCLLKHEELIKQYISNLPPFVPSLYEIQKNTSLMLINRHFSFSPPAAYRPNIVEIGGLHLGYHSNNTIPYDIRKILDESKNGVVYMSFGSLLNSVNMNTNKFEAFINVLGRLNQTVLWKWEGEKLNIFPKNFVLRDWFPQFKVLGHSNVKLFIGHGGLMGTQEAIFHGVPMLVISVFGDQYNNGLLIQQSGVGKVLRYWDFDEATLEKAVLELLTDNSYKSNSLELSKRFKDRPTAALDKAIFWIEYVVRNKGANFAKNAGRNWNWMTYYMLDIYCFILLMLVVHLYLLYSFFNRIFKSKLTTKTQNKKKNN